MLPKASMTLREDGSERRRPSVYACSAQYRNPSPKAWLDAPRLAAGRKAEAELCDLCVIGPRRRAGQIDQPEVDSPLAANWTESPV